MRRVGGEHAVKVDVRVVAATHRDLAQLVREGRFREDLYYRLRGATLTVPPLRERITDLPAMIDAFLREATLRGRPRKLPVSPEAMRLLAAYPWPGNVRELRSEVHRWAVFCDDRVEPGDLAPPRISGAARRHHARRGGPRRRGQRDRGGAHRARRQPVAHRPRARDRAEHAQAQAQGDAPGLR